MTYAVWPTLLFLNGAWRQAGLERGRETSMGGWNGSSSFTTLPPSYPSLLCQGKEQQLMPELYPHTGICSLQPAAPLHHSSGFMGCPQGAVRNSSSPRPPWKSEATVFQKLSFSRPLEDPGVTPSLPPRPARRGGRAAPLTSVLLMINTHKHS